MFQCQCSVINSPQALVNSNRNTTYNLGGGNVVNNNPVTNYIQLAKDEVRRSDQQYHYRHLHINCDTGRDENDQS